MYNYETEREAIFTEKGQKVFLQIRDKVKLLIDTAGAVRMQEIIQGCSGLDSWGMLACVDRLVELNEIKEITCDSVAGQHRVFVSSIYR